MDIFTVLADPTRREILQLLVSHRSLSATDIYNEFSVSHPAISQHLKVLREAKLAVVTKDAQQRFYQINLSALSELDDWLEMMRGTWSEKFSHD